MLAAKQTQTVAKATGVRAVAPRVRGECQSPFRSYHQLALFVGRPGWRGPPACLQLLHLVSLFGAQQPCIACRFAAARLLTSV